MARQGRRTVEVDQAEDGREANHHAKAPSWLEGIFGVLGLAWFVFSFAAVFQVGPLVSLFERYRVLFGALEFLGGLVVVYASLQFPPYRRQPVSWPTYAYDIISAAGFAAWTYDFEARLFPMLPNPGNAALALGTLLVVLTNYRVPLRQIMWVNRRIRGWHAPQAPANPA